MQRALCTVAQQLGLTESDLLQHLGAAEREDAHPLAPCFRWNAWAALVLAAIEVPEDRFEVTTQVNAFAEVAHNYRREFLNMWFVLATTTPKASPPPCAIEAAAGLPVYPSPKKEFVEMKLQVRT